MASACWSAKAAATASVARTNTERVESPSPGAAALWWLYFDGEEG
jgi:hypothetical protein